ncbi:MAG: FMN-binding negative transcriptional regulator [Rhizobiaceae bacterium]
MPEQVIQSVWNKSMHPNPVYRSETSDRNLAFAHERGFGVLAVNAETGPLLSHIPFRLSQDGRSLEAHLVRSNPIVSLLSEPRPAVLCVSGADGYISPDWYGMENQVPTWNYVAVHLRGTLSLLAQGELHGVLERLSAKMEARLLPKMPWTTAKMDQTAYERMQRQIVPISMAIDSVDGTWKLTQNKPDEARLGAAKGVRDAALSPDASLLADLMENPQGGK